MIPFQNSKKITPELMTNFLSNHDTSRGISRWGDEKEF
jgi:glycosidase